MPYPSRAALKAATGVATVLVAFAASAARAEDPFPLDPAVQAPPLTGAPVTTLSRTTVAGDVAVAHSADYSFFATVTVNGHERVRMVKLREIDGRLFIARVSAAAIGLEVAPGTQEFVAIDQLSGVTAKMDWQLYKLDLAVVGLDNPDNTVDFRRSPAAHSDRLTSVTAAMLDYDMTAQAGPAGLRVAGLVNVRLARNNTALESGWTLATGPGGGVVRLDTALRFNVPERALTLTLGDFVQTVALDSRAVRMGGIQVGSNYALRPEFITYPLPEFAGNLAVPQQIDLLVNDRRLTNTDLQAGGFALRNIPVSSGRGRLGAVIRDALGRERQIDLDFYSSRDLLAPGVMQWSASAGVIRRRYGCVSNDYGPLVGNVVVRRGLTPKLTLGLAAEGGNGVVNFGGNLDTTIGNLAEISLSFRASRLEQGGVSRHGSAVMLNLQSNGPRLSLRLSGRFVSRGYDDLASAANDPPPVSYLAIGFDFDLRKFGAISLSTVRERDTRPGQRLFDLQTRSVASLGWRRSFGALNLFAESTVRRTAGTNSFAGFVGLSLPFGPRGLASGSISHQSGSGQQLGVAFDRPAILPGDIGYSLSGERGPVDLLHGSLAYQGTWGQLVAEAEVVNGQAASRLSARGAIVLVDGALYPVKNLRGGMVLIETRGISDITLSRENQPVVISDRHSRVLMTDLIPRTAMRVGIMPGTLPRGAVADTQAELVAVPGEAVTRLDLGIRPYLPALFRLTDPRGAVFAPGTVVRTLPSGSETVVGLDGTVELNRAGDDRQLELALPDGSTCRADFADFPDQTKLTELPALRCYARFRSFPITAKTRNHNSDLSEKMHP